MSKRRGLGRGLDSLIPGAGSRTEGEEEGLRVVPIGAIQPNPHQPRNTMDEEKLAELAASIKEHGLIQPLIVNQTTPNLFTLIAGERRWRASQLAGLDTVPVLIKEATPQAMLELALIENIQRADLNPLEEAQAFRQLMDEFHLTQEEVSKRVGKARSTVANQVRLLDLPPNIQQAVADGRISGAHGRALLPLPTPESQTAVMEAIIRQELSVRQVEAVVKKILAGVKPKPKASGKLPPELKALETQFGQSLGTKVKIHQGTAGQGTVTIHFYSDEELQAIYEAIVGS
jgi:ParB family transcriptional regulator, chromosome partitioning protein